jgi:hypothetical protein
MKHTRQLSGLRRTEKGEVSELILSEKACGVGILDADGICKLSH